MKTILMFIFVFSCAFLGAATLINETFNGTTLPAGWTFQGPQVGAWSISPTIVAGGSANEVRLNYTPSGYGTYRLISPPIDTRKVHDMTLSFRHMFDHYDTQEFATIAVELAHDTESFDWELWYVAPTGDIAATQVTVPISFDLGMSETTYISFVFRGNNWNINSWYIDNIVLTYNNTLGSGTWETGNHYINGNLYIPDGHTLTLVAGSKIYMDMDKTVEVNGRLLSMGSAEQPVEFAQLPLVEPWLGINIEVSNPANDSTLINHTIIQGSMHRGVDVQYATKLRFSNCIFRNNSSPDTSSGGGLFASQCTLTLTNCDFYSNYSPWAGAAAYFTSCNVTASGNTFRNNNGQSAVSLFWTDVSGFKDNLIVNNVCTTGTEAVRIQYGSGTFSRNLVANNFQIGIYVFGSTLEILHCTIANNESYGLYNNSSEITVRNTIFESNGDIGESEIYNAAASTDLFIYYSCLPVGTANILGNGIDPANYANNQETHAQFVNPSAWGLAGNALAADWRPAYNSCTIDTGDPALPLDPDLSRADIGMHYRMLKPLIAVAEDVPNDQGHQVDLQWKRSDIDVAFYPNAFYTVWREGSSRTENVVFITDLAQITQGFDPLGRDICFRDGNRTWYYLQQVWAMNFSEYGWIAPTLLDATISGNNEVNFMVAYHNNNGIWQSIPHSGYSVDNIPPYAPARLTLTPASANQFNLTWDEVTEGVWEGNSYPELNLITYKIYAGDTPYFEISPSSYLMSTTYPFALLNNQTQNKRFYKIVVSDSE